MLISAFSYINGESVISDKFKFVWLCVPKVASRSLLWLFSDRFGNTNTCEGRQLYKLPGWSERTIELPADYFRFAFVRNPYERVASVWLDKFRNYDPASKTAKLFRKWPELSPATTFPEFVRWLGPSTRPSDDPHWKAQYRFVTDKDDRRAADFIGKIEQLDQDLAFVFEKIGLPRPEIPRLNSRDRNESGKIPYDRFYTPELRDIIRSRYEKDFSMLGYSTDMPIGKTDQVKIQITNAAT